MAQVGMSCVGAATTNTNMDQEGSTTPPPLCLSKHNTGEPPVWRAPAVRLPTMERLRAINDAWQLELEEDEVSLGRLSRPLVLFHAARLLLLLLLLPPDCPLGTPPHKNHSSRASRRACATPCKPTNAWTS